MSSAAFFVVCDFLRESARPQRLQVGFQFEKPREVGINRRRVFRVKLCDGVYCRLEKFFRRKEVVCFESRPRLALQFERFEVQRLCLQHFNLPVENNAPFDVLVFRKRIFGIDFRLEVVRLLVEFDRLRVVGLCGGFRFFFEKRDGFGKRRRLYVRANACGAR